MEVLKGRVQSINGSTAIIVPNEHPDTVTQPLVVPFYWRETMGNLQAGEECYYFEDNEHGGYIIGRTDGEWDNVLRGTLTVTESVTAQATVDITGAVTAGSTITATGDVKSGTISLLNHTHISSIPGSPSSAPQ
mgnify:CR=1 FL=1